MFYHRKFECNENILKNGAEIDQKVMKVEKSYYRFITK